jgi:hypothetical protein
VSDAVVKKGVLGGVKNEDLGGVKIERSKVVGGVKIERSKDLSGVKIERSKDLGGVKIERSKVLGGVKSESGKVLGGVKSESSKVLGGVKSESEEVSGGVSGDLRGVKEESEISIEVLKNGSEVLRNDKKYCLCHCNEFVEKSLFTSPSWDAENLVNLFEHVNLSGQPNYQKCRIPVSKLNIPYWRHRLSSYKDMALCDFLEFGFPLDVNKEQELSFNQRRNHKGAREFSEFVDKYLKRVWRCAYCRTIQR